MSNNQFFIKINLVMFYIYNLKMKINKKIILFTYGYPTSEVEDTFIKFEIDKLINDFEYVEIIPQKNFKKILKKKINNKKLNINLDYSAQFNIINILKNFFSYTIFSKNFFQEINKIIFKKNFFLKLKMSIIELTKSEIAYHWIKKFIANQNKKIVF